MLVAPLIESPAFASVLDTVLLCCTCSIVAIVIILDKLCHCGSGSEETKPKNSLEIRYRHSRRNKYRKQDLSEK
jgi:hypothetical protein